MTRYLIPFCRSFSIVVGGLLLVTSPARAQVVELKPNLIALPMTSLSVTRESGRTLLRFSTTSWNAGTGPLELRAGEISSDNQRRKVYQRVYLSDGNYYDKYAGEFEYHPEHQHFHFGNYALYTLKPVNAPGASQRQSAKTTFCVMDTTAINTSLPGAPPSSVYNTCGADIQGMSIGWGDTYSYYLAGQSVDVTDLPAGDYDLVLDIDPKTQLVESTRADNSSCLRIHLDPRARSVQSLGACTAQGGVSIDSITPSSASEGSVLFGVTIKGAGFVDGMAVGFENGTGAAPVASDVAVVDENTITLTVTVGARTGGSKRERLWDVRVGSAVLPKGFAVRP